MCGWERGHVNYSNKFCLTSVVSQILYMFSYLGTVRELCATVTKHFKSNQADHVHIHRISPGP